MNRLKRAARAFLDEPAQRRHDSGRGVAIEERPVGTVEADEDNPLPGSRAARDVGDLA